MLQECIRCGDALAVDELGYCGHCHWAVRAEIEDGFHQLEERDFERVPVVEEGGRLVGVLSRAVVQRRLAEDEPPELDPDPGSVLL